MTLIKYHSEITQLCENNISLRERELKCKFLNWKINFEFIKVILVHPFIWYNLGFICYFCKSFKTVEAVN